MSKIVYAHLDSSIAVQYQLWPLRTMYKINNLHTISRFKDLTWLASNLRLLIYKRFTITPLHHLNLMKTFLSEIVFYWQKPSYGQYNVYVDTAIIFLKMFPSQHFNLRVLLHNNYDCVNFLWILKICWSADPPYAGG